MSISNTLTTIIKESLEVVNSHPQKDLNLGYRQAIWAALGPKGDTSQQLHSIGKKRRTILAILTAQYILPFWNKIRPNDDTPYRLLTKAKRILNEELDPQTVYQEVSKYWEYMDKLANETEGTSPIIAGYSAVTALNTAINDEMFDPNNIDFNLTDADIDPYDFDTAFIASSVYANGAVWESDSDSVKRREFWNWWLTKAVPKAWQSFK